MSQTAERANTSGQSPSEAIESAPLFELAEADRWAQELRAMLTDDARAAESEAMRSAVGENIRSYTWFHRISFPELGITTTSDHSRVPAAPGGLNQLGDRLTGHESCILRPLPKWKYIERLLPDMAGKSVLELGCANGFFSLEFARRGATEVTGVEIMPRQVEAATWAAGVLGINNVRFVYADILIDREVAAHDIVFSSEVHNHFPLPFLGLLRMVNLARECVVFDNSGVIPSRDQAIRYRIVEHDGAISYVHCQMSEGLMMDFLRLIGIDASRVRAYRSPVSQSHVMYLIDVRGLDEARRSRAYPAYLKQFFGAF